MRRLLTSKAPSPCRISELVDMARREPDLLLRVIANANVRGRGGAHFPTSKKWAAALARPGPRVLIANAGEHEPGSRKDLELILRRTDLVLEGLATAAAIIDAGKVIIAVDESRPAAAEVLQAAIESARDGWRGLPLPEVTLVPSLYIVGEETALLEVLEGKAPKPRFRPPLPTVRGWMGYPTLIQNIETLANCAWAVNQYLDGNSDPKIDTFLWTAWAGNDKGVVGESEFGDTLSSVIDEAGYKDTVKAVTLGGYSGGVVRGTALDFELDPDSLRARGLSLGCGSFRIIEDHECVGSVAEHIARFFSEGSCGQCHICHQGLSDAASALTNGEGAGGAGEANSILSELSGRGVCKLPDGASMTVTGFTALFPSEIEAHVAGHCRCEAPELEAV